ncbi:hypothetical protein [Alkaliphilus peptidifermentans]|uniref:Uncharacterized protein n=1 Tax=Alkaliphilus peptidifermentans DSM 18978 TaxID=1120976 RepID=A0A1G5GBX1_9FIRM|nr:hypothetical protein [Alkaliphilus peptidifermentans]SCY48740.1 hypothetical protein SAMN03080606_01627 [Alkaliphilus peptidifermentans DSM 18978]
MKKMTRKLVALFIMLMLVSSIGTSFAYAAPTDDSSIVKEPNESISDDSIIVEDPYGDFIGEMSYEEYLFYLYGEEMIVPYSIPGVVEHKMLII